jgi:hypothetical protein
MPRFYLSIHGEHLERAMMLLNGADIPTIGAFPAYYGNQPPPDWHLDRLTAVLDADSEEAAKTRVHGVLPDGFTVELRDPRQEPGSAPL